MPYIRLAISPTLMPVAYSQYLFPTYRVPAVPLGYFRRLCLLGIFSHLLVVKVVRVLRRIAANSLLVSLVGDTSVTLVEPLKITTFALATLAILTVFLNRFEYQFHQCSLSPSGSLGG